MFWRAGKIVPGTNATLDTSTSTGTGIVEMDLYVYCKESDSVQS